jgi:hypothetical protein
MFAMKPSVIRAKVITLAGRRSDHFWELGNALLMLRDTSPYGRFQEDREERRA